MNRRTIVTGSLVSSALATVVLVAAPASASRSVSAARYGVVNATVNAATDHEVGASTAFPNYTSGAVDNYYSLAHTHIDNSPFAEGTASPADSGPLGQTAAAGNFQQPQYADARWPGAKSGRTASFGNQGGPSAYATAASYNATALSSDASASGAPGSGKIKAPKGFERRLRLALAAWKARWLGPLGLKVPHPHFASLRISAPTLPPVPTVPTPTVPGVTIPNPGGTTTNSTTTSSTTTTPAPSGQPANGGLMSSSRTWLDPKSGAIVTSGESRLGSVNLGGGVVLKHIDVIVKITNSGKPKGKATVRVGGATVGGVPVTIDEHGVHVAHQGSGLPYGQADAAMNTALKQAGLQLFTVKPQIKKSKCEMAITATGVHVIYTQPVDQSGVPSQKVEHIYGEVFADSLACPAPPLPKFHIGGPSSGPGVGGVGGSNGFGSGGGGGTTSVPSSPSSGGTGSTSGGTPAAFTTIFGKPLWLLIAYLVWQSLVVATGATLWRWRVAGAAT